MTETIDFKDDARHLLDVVYNNTIVNEYVSRESLNAASGEIEFLLEAKFGHYINVLHKIQN